MRRMVKIRHPILWYQLLLVFALGNGAPTELVRLGTGDLAVNLGCDPVKGRLPYMMS
jgi:hypothetical protein